MKTYIPSVINQFKYYKTLGDKTINQLSYSELTKVFEQNSNSISIIVKHIAGNMLSRWTNFLTEDGEKEWRHRDEEFIDTFKSKDEILHIWDKGWNCLIKAIQPLSVNDLEQFIYIRNQTHTITEAINRQMMHYAYHIGQIIYLVDP